MLTQLSISVSHLSLPRPKNNVDGSIFPILYSGPWLSGWYVKSTYRVSVVQELLWDVKLVQLCGGIALLRWSTSWTFFRWSSALPCPAITLGRTSLATLSLWNLNSNCSYTTTDYILASYDVTTSCVLVLPKAHEVVPTTLSPLLFFGQNTVIKNSNKTLHHPQNTKAAPNQTTL